MDFEIVFESVRNWLTNHGVDFAMNIVKVIVLLIVGKVLIKWIVLLAKAAMFKTFTGNPMIPSFIVSIISKVLWLMLLMMVATCLSINITPLIMGLGVTGFVVGFACQDSLANLAAGIMIAMNEPFTVGDSVTVAGVTGVIHEVSMMATVVRDEAGNRVVVPNKAAWGGVITNRTRKIG